MKEHLVIGSALAAVVVFFFLANVRATLIAALSIPASIVAAFAIIHYMGFTLNSLTLLALTLSVGIVIDDAIVVMENIFRYIEEKRYSPYEAALAATAEIGLAVLAITLSLVAVFLPIAMMEGIVGRFLKSFGITMAATIVVSMLVSFTLTPMLAARWFRRGKSDSPVSPRPLAGEGQGVRAVGGPAGTDAAGSKGQVFYHAIETVYLAMLRFSLRQRWVVVLGVVGCLATLPMFFRVLPKCFTPEEDSSEFQVSVLAPEGRSLEYTQVQIARIARDIRTLPDVRYTIGSVADSDQRNPYEGTIYVRLTNIADRKVGPGPNANHGSGPTGRLAAVRWPTTCGSASRRCRSSRVAA